MTAQPAWISGAGYQLTLGSTVFVATDPAMINLGERGIWTGIKETMAGATKLFGNTNRIQQIKVVVPSTTACPMNTPGDTLLAVLLTNATGGTSTASGLITGISGPNLQPNSVDGNQIEVTIDLGGNSTQRVLTPV